ncbi:hypothetical protein GCM10020001_037940 [Nonomuraea salmonea]
MGGGQGGERDGDGRPEHALLALEPQAAGGDDAGRRPGGDHRGGVAAAHEVAGDRDAGPGAAQAGQRALVHGQRLLGPDDRDLLGGVVVGERLVQHAGRADEHDGQAAFADGVHGSGHDLVGRVVAAHGVERDRPAL